MRTETNHQEASEVPTTEPTTPQRVDDTPFPPLEVEYPQSTPIISQDEHMDTSATAHNTWHQRKVRTITQDFLYHLMDTPNQAQPFTNKQAAARKYPLQFLCDFANAVIDDEMGDLLEYQRLLKHPKHKDVWSKSCGTEI